MYVSPLMLRVYVCIDTRVYLIISAPRSVKRGVLSANPQLRSPRVWCRGHRKSPENPVLKGRILLCGQVLERTGALRTIAESMKTVLYCRVSTLDQTLEHQQHQAEQAGFRPDLVLADHGVSGVSTRLRERPEGKRLFDVLREGDVLVVRWIDRLGRNYQDVTDTIREFIRRQIRIETVINRMTFDGTTTDPMKQAVRDALIAFMAATAQSQAEVIKEAQKAGIAHAQAIDDGTKYRGRKPTFNLEQFRLVQDLLRQGIAISAIAQTTGLKRQSIYRIQSRPEQQLAALQAWYASESTDQHLR
jgi:putative DNA-invertase from lambdoid prophage Rac